MAKIDIESLKTQIAQRLKPLEPQKVILFGSYAYGTPDENSDIDLYVVTKDDFVPQNWKEKSEVHLKVAKAMQDLLRLYPTDLITHTKPYARKVCRAKYGICERNNKQRRGDNMSQSAIAAEWLKSLMASKAFTDQSVRTLQLKRSSFCVLFASLF